MRRYNLLSGLAEPLKIAGWLLRGQEGLNLMRGATYHDRRLMRDLALSHQLEIQLGDLALEKAISDDVCDFARLLVQDHTEALLELQTLADLENVPLPEAGEKGHAWRRLETKSGIPFERAYIEEMVRRHDDAIGLAMRISTDACLPRLRTLALRVIPVLQHHHDRAKTLEQQRREAA